MPIPVKSNSTLGLSSHRTPAWSWPRSRRSACFPAVAYPPPRPLVVYPQRRVCATMERKKSLIISALSDMIISALSDMNDIGARVDSIERPGELIRACRLKKQARRRFSLANQRVIAFFPAQRAIQSSLLLDDASSSCLQRKTRRVWALFSASSNAATVRAAVETPLESRCLPFA